MFVCVCVCVTQNLILCHMENGCRLTVFYTIPAVLYFAGEIIRFTTELGKQTGNRHGVRYEENVSPYCMRGVRFCGKALRKSFG